MTNREKRAADAHLVRYLLQHAGIAVPICNEYATATLGEVPMGSAYPQLWISQLHQDEHARAVNADYEQRPAQTTIKHCCACGETNPGEFDLCWHCGAALANAH